MQIARLAIDGRPEVVVGCRGRWVPLSQLVPSWATLAGSRDEADPAGVFAVLDEVRWACGSIDPEILEASPSIAATRRADLLCPLVRPGKIMGIGLNYAAHAAETSASLPAVPLVFAKWPTALAAPEAALAARPEVTSELDYEGELAVVIGRRCRDVAVDDALGVVGAYAVANDVSARDRQYSEGGQWSHSKSFDGFCPLGPWLTSADEVADPQDLRITTTVNGEVRQDCSTSQMVFPVAQLVSFLSVGTTLEPGDVILTGTPPGVARGMPGKPYLGPGDVVDVAISTLGALTTRVTAPVGPGGPEAQ